MKYFSSDDEGMISFHKTEGEARKAAEDSLECATDGDINEDAVNRICWGVVRGSAVETERISLEEAIVANDDANASTMQRYGWDFIVKYEMQDEPGTKCRMNLLGGKKP